MAEQFVTALENEGRQGGLTIIWVPMMKETMAKHLLPMLIYMMIYREDYTLILHIKPLFKVDIRLSVMLDANGIGKPISS